MLNDYFGEPEYLDGVGYIYPVKIYDYNDFNKLASKYLVTSKETIEAMSKQKTDLSLLEIIWQRIFTFEFASNEDYLYLLDKETKDNIEEFKTISEEDKLSLSEFIKLLTIILKCNIEFDEDELEFRLDNESIKSNKINKENFEKFRTIVMRQNLLFEPLFYEDFILQQMLESWRAMQKNNSESQSTLEGMLQVIALTKGKNPSELKDYTYYQVVAEYSRIQVLQQYDWVKSIQTSGYGSNDIKTPNIAEDLNLNQHPEESGFFKGGFEDVDEKLNT